MNIIDNNQNKTYLETDNYYYENILMYILINGLDIHITQDYYYYSELSRVFIFIINY